MLDDFFYNIFVVRFESISFVDQWIKWLIAPINFPTLFFFAHKSREICIRILYAAYKNNNNSATQISKYCKYARLCKMSRNAIQFLQKSVVIGRKRPRADLPNIRAVIWHAFFICVFWLKFKRAFVVKRISKRYGNL